MGFIVVADVSSSATFTDAFHVIDFVFERLQFDISDNICCPVSMVLVGAKCDLRGAKRDRNLGSEAEIRAMIEQRYRNIDVGNVNVVYLEARRPPRQMPAQEPDLACVACAVLGAREPLPRASGGHSDPAHARARPRSRQDPRIAAVSAARAPSARHPRPSSAPALGI